MKKKLFILLFFSCSIFGILAQTPDAAEILDGVRMSQTSAAIDVPGVIRIGPKRFPFRLVSNNGVITYRFEDPEEALILRLGKNKATLERESGGKIAPVSEAGRADAVRGTDVTLQDLSLDFLYWNDAEVLGEQIVGPRRTWKVQLRAPSSKAPYAAVMAFIDQSGGALMQMDAYDWNGKIIRRFRVTSGQKIKDMWMLKQMRVERMDPASGKVISRTYIEISEDK